MLKEKLTSEFLESLKNFQVIQRTAAQKEKESISRARANSVSKGAADDSNLIDLQSPEGQQQQHQISLQIEEQVDLDLLREREQSIKKIETDIVEVNQIFKDIAKIVHENNEVLDSIEANVETATIHVSEGAQQIARAREYHVSLISIVVCYFWSLLNLLNSFTFYELDYRLTLAQYILKSMKISQLFFKMLSKFDS